MGHKWPRYCPGLTALEFGGSGRMETELGVHSQLCQLQGEKGQTAWRSWVASPFSFISHRKSMQLVVLEPSPLQTLFLIALGPALLGWDP